MKAITSEQKKEIKNKSPQNARNARSESIYELSALGLLTAICFIMCFTPIGYIKTPVLSITLMTVPVIISATVLKPRDSAIIGGIFGITSFIQAVSGMSALTSALFQLNPFFTFILCVVPRVLEGWLGGLIFQGVKKIDKTNFISYAVGSLSVPLLNTLLFMSTLFILFYNSAPIQNIASDKGADNVFALFTAMVGVQALIEAGICFAIGTAVSKALAVALKKVKK